MFVRMILKNNEDFSSRTKTQFQQNILDQSTIFLW